MQGNSLYGNLKRGARWLNMPAAPDFALLTVVRQGCLSGAQVRQMRRYNLHSTASSTSVLLLTSRRFFECRWERRCSDALLTVSWCQEGVVVVEGCTNQQIFKIQMGWSFDVLPTA